MPVDAGKPNLESPLQQREVQWTVLFLASMILIALMVSWNSGRQFDRAISVDEPNAEMRGETGVVAGIQIDINHAQVHELALLPGVGPVLADRIVHDRSKNGDFISVEDLRRVFGIGEKTMEEVSRLCVVGKVPVQQIEIPESVDLSR